MQATSDLIVLSDLHLAPTDVEWTFADSTEVARLLDWVADEVRGPCHIVIAGDVFDCLLRPVPPRGPVLEPESTPTFVASVLASHPKLGAALRRLARSPRHELTFLSGNHDAELVLPAAQLLVEHWLGRAAGRPPLRWVVYGEGVRFVVGGARVLVDHGDLFDDWNRIDHDGLRLALARVQRGLHIDGRYREPAGSRLFREFVLPLGSRYPWVSALKPEREAVIPLLHALLPAHQRPSFRKAVREAVIQLTRSFLASMVGKGKPAELRRPPEWLRRRQSLLAWLAAEERTATRGSAESRKVRGLIKRLRKVSAEDTYFEIGAHDCNAGLVSELLGRDLDAVVCGHTHAAKAHTLGRGLYLNTGAWQQLLQLPISDASNDEWESFLGSLETGGPMLTWRRTFARIRARSDDTGATASLYQWRDSRLTTLREFSFDPGARRWEVMA